MRSPEWTYRCPGSLLNRTEEGGFGAAILGGGSVKRWAGNNLAGDVERINHTLGRATNTFGQVEDFVRHPNQVGQGFSFHLPHDLTAVDFDGRFAGS